jgi:hypothetical protein
MHYLGHMSFENRQLFQDVVVGAADKIGIELDMSTAFYKASDQGQETVVQSADQALDLHFLRNTDTPCQPVPLASTYGAERYMLRGLLRSETGTLIVTKPGTRPTNLIVNIVNSVKTLNDVQQLLGRKPGFDAFKQVVLPGGQQLKPGQFVAAAPRHEIPAAGFRDWYWAGVEVVVIRQRNYSVTYIGDLSVTQHLAVQIDITT